MQMYRLCDMLSLRDAYMCVAMFGKCLSARESYMNSMLITTTATTITFAATTSTSITNIYTSWNTPLRSGLVSRSLVSGPSFALEYPLAERHG